MGHIDATGTEVLSSDERAALAAELAVIGPWKLAGTAGSLRAERGGSAKHEQAAASAAGLVAAVRAEEARLAALAEETPTLDVLTAEGVADSHEYAERERLDAPLIEGRQRWTRGGYVVG